MAAVSQPQAARKGLNIGLWVIQALLALTLVGGGVWKMATPLAQVAESFAWVGEVPPILFYGTSVFDVLGGLGVLLPSLTRVKPGLTVLAALGLVALQGSAIVFHVSRGEAADTPFNFVLVALALVVAWGRYRQAPIAPR
ncbi:DoxX family protein [Nonomuraea sp. NPDC049714]|uniref:DoxX family protein n=1 Tax=Nonomuraea sp. NPDC049714 TaxID=3364357 RepID=UPI0037B32C8D